MAELRRQLSRLARQLVPGLSTAVLFIAAGAIAGEALDLGMVTRVGLPSFVGGLLLFPVNARTLGGRLCFARRAALAGLAAALVHRVLFWANGGPGLCPSTEVQGPFDALVFLAMFLDHPSLSVLLPHAHASQFLGVEATLVMEGLAVALAAASAYALHPLLASALHVPARPAREEEAELQPELRRVRVR